MTKEFEPGSVRCCRCGEKPEDMYDPEPEGFYYPDGDCYCDHCIKIYNKEYGGDAPTTESTPSDFDVVVLNIKTTLELFVTYFERIARDGAGMYRPSLLEYEKNLLAVAHRALGAFPLTTESDSAKSSKKHVIPCAVRTDKDGNEEPGTCTCLIKNLRDELLEFYRRDESGVWIPSQDYTAIVVSRKELEAERDDLKSKLTQLNLSPEQWRVQSVNYEQWKQAIEERDSLKEKLGIAVIALKQYRFLTVSNQEHIASESESTKSLNIADLGDESIRRIFEERDELKKDLELYKVTVLETRKERDSLKEKLEITTKEITACLLYIDKPGMSNRELAVLNTLRNSLAAIEGVK